MRILGFLIVFLAAGAAFADKTQGDVQNGAVKGGGTSKSSASAKANAAAYSASASKSSAKQAQRQTQTQGQVALGTVQTDSHDRYESAKNVVSTAAELNPTFCAGSGMSVQTSYVGLSNTDRDYVCARIELFRAYLEAEQGVQRLQAALEFEVGPKGGKNRTVAAETLRAVAADVHGRAIEQLKLADERLSEDDTRTRKYFVRALGSLPILSWIAPR